MLPQLSDRAKFFLRLAAFVGSAGLLGFALYYFFFAQPPSVIQEETQETETESKDTSSLPGSGTRTPATSSSSTGSGTSLPAAQIASGGRTVTTQLTTSSITSPTRTTAGTIAYYDKTEGRFYHINASGEVELLSLEKFPEAEEVLFDNSASSAVITFPDGSNTVYNFASAKQVTLPTHWEDFSFSPDGKELVAKSIGTNTENQALIITAADGSSATAIAALGENADKVIASWSPANTLVGFSETGEGTSTFGQKKIYTIGKDGTAQATITINGTNYQNIWSPSGKYILYSIAAADDDYKPGLWYVDAKGDRNGKIRLELPVKTTVDRCAFFDEETIYCGVPTQTPAGSGSSPEILTGPDYLYKINVPSGTATLLAIPGISTVIKNISISADESILYYTDSRDRLNMMRLK